MNALLSNPPEVFYIEQVFISVALEATLELSNCWLCPNANGGKEKVVGKLIEFYIPQGFRLETKRDSPVETARVIEFPSGKAETFHQVTWIVPEIDADLA